MAIAATKRKKVRATPKVSKRSISSLLKVSRPNVTRAKVKQIAAKSALEVIEATSKASGMAKAEIKKNPVKSAIVTFLTGCLIGVALL